MKLEIVINGVPFIKINQPWFVVYGEEDKLPFLQSGLYDGDNDFPSSNVGNFPRREYKSIQVNGKFYAPIFTEQNELTQDEILKEIQDLQDTFEEVNAPERYYAMQILKDRMLTLATKER